jgi:hypothetical protein
MIQVIFRPPEDELLQAHTEEIFRRYGSSGYLSVGWAQGERSISSKNYDTREILTTRLRRGKIIHRVEDF